MFFSVVIGGLVLGILLVVAYISFLRYRAAHPVDVTSKSSLKTEQLQTETLLRSVADGIFVIDTSGRVKLTNPAGSDMVGWPGDESINIDINKVVKFDQVDGKPLPGEENPFTKVIHEKQAVKSTLQLTARDNKKKIVSVVVSPVVLPPDYQLAGAVAVLRDISRQHQEESQRADFISTASHEMRTPVAAIEGYLALAMNDKVSKIDSKARAYLEKAHASAGHLGKLFQDLLTSAKAEDGRLNYAPSVVEMGDFLDQITQDLRFAAEKKGLRMEYVIGSTGPIDASQDSNSKVVRPLYYVYADPDRLREVVTNIFDNAIKYTDNGKISVGLTGNKDLVQFFIRDTGAGIAQEDVPHLFQKFYRVNNSLTRTQGGTGLGLFISAKIIELCNGRIWVESELSKGSTFYINLPRLDNQRAAELQTKQKASLNTALPQEAKVQ